MNDYDDGAVKQSIFGWKVTCGQLLASRESEKWNYEEKSICESENVKDH